MRHKVKFLIFIFSGIIGFILFYIFFYLYPTYKGFLRIYKKPSKDISKIIEKQSSTTTSPSLPLKLEQNFKIAIFAKDLGKIRDLEFDPNKNLTAVSLDKGKVFVFKNSNKEKIELLSNLDKPHSIAFDCKNKNSCKLYLAQTDGIYIYDYDPEKIKAKDGKKIIDLPPGGRHFTRTIILGKGKYKDKIFISVGSSCDTCYEKDWRRAKILVADKDGKNLKVFAKGLRNSVFMAWHPQKNFLFATEMGRDYLGDDLPPDEINIIKEGKDYGWPICYGKNIHDTVFDKRKYVIDPCFDKEPSFIDIQAHSAPLGLAFVPFESKFPKQYWGNLLVAYHGSWNRTIPTGYKIVRYIFDKNLKLLKTKDFISGWLTKDFEVLGRPVDILIDKEGKIYISDDKTGIIYEVFIEYTK